MEDFRVEKLENGYTVTAWKDSGEIYQDPEKAVASSEAEVIGFLTKWLKGDPKPFKKD